MKRVLFVTDSLGAPRKKPEECTFDDLWCYKVVKGLKIIEPVYININGLDTNKLLSETLMKLTLYNPDIVVIQVGIVDCAPRALNETEKRIVRRLGFLGEYIHRIIKKNYSSITKTRNISYVSSEKFEENLECIKKCFNGIPVFAIAIGKPTKKYIEKSPLIQKRYKVYNNIMKNSFKDYFIDPYNNLDNIQLEDIYMSDLHHLNKKGQILVAEYVSQKLITKALMKSGEDFN